MAVVASPLWRRVFTQLQTTGSTGTTANLRTINNASGVWSNTGSKFIRVPLQGVEITAADPITPVPWLTGTRSMQPGIRGRKAGSCTLRNVPIIPSGSTSTVPDTDHIWQTIFGGPATSNTYSFNDAGFLPLTILDFFHAQTTLPSRLTWGSVCSGAEIRLNGDVLTGDFTFPAGYGIDSNTFGGLDTVGAAGLTAWPIEPSSPTYLGSIIPGFGATVVIDSLNFETKIRSLNIRISTGVQLIGDFIADAYPAQIVGGMRQIGISFGVIQDDSAAVTDLMTKAKALSAPTVNAVITVGTVTGSKVIFNVTGLQLVSPTQADESAFVMLNFPEAMAHGSAVGTTDDLTMQFA